MPEKEVNWKRGIFQKGTDWIRFTSAMSSKNKNSEKREVKNESILEEGSFEIKEIIERTPAKQERGKHPGNGRNSSGGFFKQWVGKLLSGINNVIKEAQKGPKRVPWISFGIGAVLLVAVIVLSVRLGGVTKELKAVQALSAGLQEELDLLKVQQESSETGVVSRQPEEREPSGGKLTVVATVTPEPTATPEPERYVVCIDAGHGGWDGGAVLKENGVEKRAEKDDNLWMSGLLKEALEAYDVEVVMTRETDVFLGLSERARIANAAGADALISFHRNSYDGTDDVNGVEFWIHNSKPEGAQTLAERMLQAVVAVGGLENRGVKYGSMSSTRENYSINREANMTSMIVELGFVTSAKDNAAYDANGKAYAEGMAKAIYEWLEETGSKNITE